MSGHRNSDGNQYRDRKGAAGPCRSRLTAAKSLACPPRTERVGTGHRTANRPLPNPPRADGTDGCRSAYLLLEVVLSLGLLLMGLATIGMQVQSSWDTSVEMHQVMRAMNLAESKLAELDAQLIVDVESAVENDLEEEFGRLFPDYAWRLRIEPTVTDDLWQVSLKILYNRRLDVEEEFDFDTAKVVYDVNTLRATPATIDPQRDFGADEESMEQLVDALAGTDLDPYNLDLRQLGGLPLEDLLGLLTALEETGLLGGMDLSTMLPPDVMQMLDEILGSTDDEASPDDGGDGS